MKCRYEQLIGILEEKIRNGSWPVGTKIPGEIELAKMYQVGRSTIRETLNALQQRGMIEKQRGSGTYVIENKKAIENPLLILNSVGRMIEAAGYEVGSLFKSTRYEVPNQSICHKMQLEPNEKIVIVNRARTANNRPVAFSYNIFKQSVVGDLFHDGLEGSILQKLEELNIKLKYADTEIKGINLKNLWDQEASSFLQSPIVLMEQMHFDEQDYPVMYSFDYINTDLVKLHIRRQLQ